MFSESTNRVLWRMVTGKPVEDKTASWLNDVIRDTFRMAERSKLSHLLQARYLIATYSDKIDDISCTLRNNLTRINKSELMLWWLFR